MQNIDDGGNHSMNFEDVVGSIVTDEAPTEETPQVKDSKTEEPEVEVEEDEIDSILDDLTDDDDDEAGDTPDEDSNDTEEESEEDGGDTHLVKIDGEEHEVSLSELKKGYGLQQSLTRKGQELAETKKALEKEVQAVQWAKETPERRQLADQIAEANDAILKGFTFDADGNQIPLTKDQIERTQANVAEAQGKLREMATPPRLDELREAMPEIFSADQAVRQSLLEPFGKTLAEVGYSEAEITSQNDPRIFFLLKELHEARDVVKRVEAAKAKRKDKKPSIASKTTKAAKTAPSRKSESSGAKSSTKDIWDKVAKGEASPADLFMD